MHIPDGIVPLSVAAGGYAVAGAATWYSLQKINQLDDPRQNIPKASLLAAAFFVASTIHLPVPPTSVHLILNGLLGVVLGYYAFPAIIIGLFFQAVMFQHGGLTTLGLNACIMGLPALLSYHIFQLRDQFGKSDHELWTGGLAFVAAATAVLLSTVCFFTVVISFIPADINAATEQAAITTLALAHVPLALIEGAFTAALAIFLMRVKPELLRGLREARVG